MNLMKVKCVCLLDYTTYNVMLTTLRYICTYIAPQSDISFRDALHWIIVELELTDI